MSSELNEAIKDRLQDIELALNESSIVAITDKRGVIQFANDKFCEISKFKREELIGSNQNIVNSGYHEKSFFREMWRTIGRGSVWKGEVKNKGSDGSFYWVDTTIVPFLNEDGKPDRYISIRHDITKLKEYEETIREMAYTDPLTLLPNRNFLNEWLSHRVSVDCNTLTVLFIDIDRFKSINDNLGHRAGDVVLKEVAKRLQTCLEETDFIIRQGGDEFVIFLNEVQAKKDVIITVENILKQFTYPFFLEGENTIITASIGISMSTAIQDKKEYAQMAEQLIRQADTAMYYAKKQGGNSYSFNTNDQNDEQERYYLVEYEVRKALCQNEFSIVYQPIVKLERNELVGVEALLRWNSPRLGFVSPMEFIPILEELGGIEEVGKWVLRTACFQLKAWQSQDKSIQRMCINVSPIQFRNKNFVDDVTKVLTETGIPPKCLELEITEGTILHIGKSEQVLNKLRALGVRISIDDFGTGYSSLSYLKNLPIHTLKIDKSFIDDLDQDGEVIANTIVSMGKNLGFNVVAEGIEKREQLSYLRHVGCHEGQGYYWSKPTEPQKIERLYEKWNWVDIGE